MTVLSKTVHDSPGQPDRDCKPFSACLLFTPSGEYWIRKKYFCDGRVNCPMDLASRSESNSKLKPPLDEADKSCATTPAPPTTSSTTTQKHLPFDDNYGINLYL